MLCISMLLWSSVHAQDPIYRSYGLGNGLRGKSIFYCFQDSRKNLWVTTDYGIANLQGIEFKALGEDQGMPEMPVLKVAEDVRGNLWFFTMNGTPARFDGTQVTTQWGEKFSKEVRGANFISSFAAEKDGSVVFGTQDGRAFRISPDSTSELLFAEPWGTVTYIEVEPDGDLWFVLSWLQGTATWSKATGKINFHPQTRTAPAWRMGPLRTIKHSDGRIIHAVEDRITATVRRGDTLHTLFARVLPGRQIVYIGEDWKQNLWIGTNNGVLQYLPGDTLLEHPKVMLEGEFVSSVCRDHESNIWFTTSEGVKQCKNENILTSNPQVCRKDDEATAIFASNDGMIYVGYARGKIQQYSRKSRGLVAEYAFPTDHPNPRIVRILDNPEGGVLAGSYAGLVLIKDRKIELLSNNRFSDISIYKDQVCACLYAGWTTFSLDRIKDPKSLEAELTALATKKGTRCLRSEYDPKGNLWISSFSEVIRSNAAGIDTIYQQGMLDAGYKNSFLLASHTGWYMYGTSNHGLFMFAKGKTFVLNRRNGLSDNHVVGVMESSSGDIWVVTSLGMSKVDMHGPEPKVEKTISRIDHFGGAEVRDLAMVNDTLWAAAGNGYVTFPVSLTDQALQPPAVELTAVWVNGSKQQLGKALELPHDQNNLRITYIPKTFTSPELIEYRYRISGGVDNKLQPTTATSLEFPNLAPGSYGLELQARHPSSDWGTPQTLLRFEITPPFWQTTWFKLIVFLIVVGSATLVVRQVINDLRKKAAIREALLEARHDALITQMNPHFIFNSLNSIQNFILTHQAEAANDYLGDFAALMRSILANGRKTSISILEEVKFLSLYLKLEALRLDHKFEYHINISKGIATGSIQVPPMLLQPLIENAVWHGVAMLEGRKGRVNLDIVLKGDILECTVRDNGIGREAALEIYRKSGKKHESFATTIMKERLELMNSSQKNQLTMEIIDLKNEDGSPAGTEVRLSLPVQLQVEGAA